MKPDTRPTSGPRAALSRSARPHHSPAATLSSALLASALAACGGNNDNPPQLSAAKSATLVGTCAALAGKLSFSNTTITATTEVAAGALTVAGQAVPAHCLVSGKMNERTSPVDGQDYAIGFEMRLPLNWNGRFFYQGNGGIDGSVVTATGASGGGPTTHALSQGFAVISSDAGHVGSQGPFFGLDPQARLDYGYRAAQTLTPMAKSLITTAYGKAPDRSYFGGCSNGGRHTFNAFARMPDQYDGYLAGAPGYRLPLAAIANIFGAQRYASVATDPADLATAFTAAERNTVASAVLSRCDALDGATDGLVQDVKACQAAFSLASDVPTCSGERDGSCLSAAQKVAIAPIFSGAVDSQGAPFYAPFPYDSGVGQAGNAFWEFFAPIALDSGGVAAIWGVPPVSPASFNGPAFVFGNTIDQMLSLVKATDGTYTESSLSFMIPPHPTQLDAVRDRGAKIMVYHGVSDPIFSPLDTVAWYDGVKSERGGDASDFARLYLVPGMGHCSGGPATDQFDMLTQLVAWVEQGQKPERVLATARGAGNAGGVNAEVPASWAANRSRPLCPYPLVARYNGSGSLESADSFSCKP